MTSFLTVAVTISACGPGQKSKTTTVPKVVDSGQKLLGTQLGEDQPVSAESMEILGKDWAERPAEPSHRRVRTKTPQTTPFLPEAEVEGPQPLPTQEQLEAAVPLPEAAAPAEGPSDPLPAEESKEAEVPEVPPQTGPVNEPGADQPAPPPPASPTPTVPAPIPPAGTTENPPSLPPGINPVQEPQKVAPLPQLPVTPLDEDVLAPIDPELLKLDQSTRTVRVLIFPHVTHETPFVASERPGEARLSNEGGLILTNVRGQQIAQGKSVKFSFTKNKIRVGNQEFPLEHTVVIPRNEEHLTAVDDIRAFLVDHGKSGKLIKAKHYRGKFVVSSVKNRREKDPRWSVINYVDIEDYVVSVVPQEIGNDTKRSAEAIRAQAIAARTYAVHHLLRAREQKHEFDVDPTTFFQVYGGFSGEDRNVSPVVDQTQGQILVHSVGGSFRVIAATFSANSGGHTCLPQECFGGYATPYLQAVRDVEGVRAVKIKGTRSGTVKASGVITILERMKLNAQAKLEKIKSVQVTERTPSDRVKRLTVDALAANGESISYHLDAKQTQQFLAAIGFRNTYLDFISSNGSEIKYYSYGHGHGVGLSQDGAIIQAKQGRTATQILAFYFANTRITNLSSTKVR